MKSTFCTFVMAAMVGSAGSAASAAVAGIDGPWSILAAGTVPSQVTDGHFVPIVEKAAAN